MKTKCMIIDDEPLALQLIESYILKIPNLDIVARCSNAIEGFEILKKQSIDLIFLDIQMPLLTGIEFLNSLQNPPKVILTTAYRDYAPESYELEVVDYLLKPISFTRFFKAIDKYFEKKVTVDTKINHQDISISESILINMNKKYYKVFCRDILYAESLKDYIRIHTSTGKITTKDKISDFEKKLPPYFIRTHRSYIVNTSKITAFTANDVEIGDVEIPIGISYKQDVFRKIKEL